MNIGIDIGGTKMIAASWGEEPGKLRQTSKHPTPPRAEDSITVMRQLIDELGEAPVGKLAIAVASPLDLEQGIVLDPPNLPWRNFHLRDAVEQALGVTAVIEHDAACGAYSEALAGAGKGYRRVLYLTISTGIGTGLVIDQQIYHGAHDIEGGHITIKEDGPVCSCGGRGHFEALVSGRAIKRRFGKLAYEIHDEATWNIISHDLAVGISSLVAILSPDIVVLGGGVSVHYDRFGHLLDRHLHGLVNLFPLPPVVPAKHIETAVVRGALMLADHQK